MSFALIGFLSPEVDGYRAQQRQRLRDEFAATETLMRQVIALATAPEAVGTSATPAYILGMAYWLRSFEASQATVILAERGLQASALATLRTAFECLFYACALWREPELLPRLQALDAKERIRQAQAIIRAGAEDREPPASLKVLREVSAEALPTAEPLTVWDAAFAAGYRYEYEMAYRGLGLGGAHASPRSLDSFCDPKGDGTVDLGVDPTFEKLPWILGLVRTCLEGGISRQVEAARLYVS